MLLEIFAELADQGALHQLDQSLEFVNVENQIKLN